MGKFTDLVAKNAAPKQESLNPVWGDHFPLLMEAFYPAPGKATGTFLTPKYSVTLFSEGTKLKAVIGARGAPKKFWTTLDGPEAVLEQLEICLLQDDGEWRDAVEEK